MEEVTPTTIARMTPGFSGAEIENLVNTAISQAVHDGKEAADLDDFEYARDRIMMGIERKKLTMSEKDRLNTAIHEAGHAVACYYTEGAKNLYKATIVARGGALGATFMLPDENDAHNITKQKAIAHIDVAMGGQVAERLFLGDENVTAGCGGDLKSATDMAYQAVRKYGMFGNNTSYMSTDKEQNSDDYNSMVDKEVTRILEVSSPSSSHNNYRNPTKESGNYCCQRKEPSERSVRTYTGMTILMPRRWMQLLRARNQRRIRSGNGKEKNMQECFESIIFENQKSCKFSHIFHFSPTLQSKFKNKKVCV